MIFPDISYEEWVLRYPELIVTEENCSINFCQYCDERIIPKIPFIKKGYVGLLSKSCPNCNNDDWSSVSITNSKEEYDLWNSLI